MQRHTIDFGIDLGTTNSEIAVLEGTTPRIIPNSEGAAFTPSAVWMDKRNRLYVGREAKSHQVDEEEGNCAIEFKIKMGLGNEGKKRFQRSGREFLPEELSAEVLKSLKADVYAQTGEDLKAVVITVPADFKAPQTNATLKAARLAGFEISPLLQEPVAAALAYAFQEENEKVFWLVYDFGGGTFDAAVMQIRDGVIQVVNHAGDNFLGGKLIDWDIVDKCFIPALTGKYRLTNFRRGDDKWRSATAKLKLHAEQAKIEVCRTERPFQVWIEALCQDDTGHTIDFEYTLPLAQVEQIFAPYVERSLNLCRKALSEKGLSGANIQKVLMVGGTTCNRWLRDKVAAELGAPLEFGRDPITVVAQGAAIFAGTQRYIPLVPKILAPGTMRLDLEYEPVDTSTDPPVGGRLVHPSGGSLKGYTIEFVDPKSLWRSGRLTLGDDGAFMTDVHAEKGRLCEFLIEVCDPSGVRQLTEPDRFPYRVGTTTKEATLIHSIGVAMANNEVDVFVEKGAPLPARKLSYHKTVHAVRKGQDGDVMKIPVVEGENIAKADRNNLIGYLKIPSKDPRVKMDIPQGSDVEITIVIDESRIITTKAFIPILDEEFEEVLELETSITRLPELNRRFNQANERLAKSREQARLSNDAKALAVIARIDTEKMPEELASHFAAGVGDTDALLVCENRLLDFEAAVDQAEDALAWPNLVKEADSVLADTKKIIGQYGKTEDRDKLVGLERDLKTGIASDDPDVLKRRVEEVRALYVTVLTTQPGFWVGYFEYLETEKSNMRDSAQAEQLFAQGRRAINSGDVESLKAVVRQLISLLPHDIQERARGFGGSTIR